MSDAAVRSTLAAFDMVEKAMGIQPTPEPRYRNVCDDPIVRQIKRTKDDALGALADLIEDLDHRQIGTDSSAYRTAVRLCVRHGMLDREYLDGLEPL